MIISSDIIYKYSIASGSAGNTLTQPDPNAALGKYASTTQWSGGTLNDLFDDITDNWRKKSVGTISVMNENTAVVDLAVQVF
jgi:hypothetical protein